MKKVLRFSILLMLLAVMFLTGCKPYQREIHEEISPNETAYLIPLESGTQDNQQKFQSVDFLEDAKVAAKRVVIPTRWYQKGRYANRGEWIPVATLLRVDRSPVTRVWTADGSTGTTSANQAINVESSDSIGFSVGTTCTAMVEEKNTSKFLYWFSGKDMSYIMDNNIWSFVSAEMAKEFGNYNLAQGRTKKGEIMATVAERTEVEFAEFGVTIASLGLSGGLVYDDPEIQRAINNEFKSETLINVAENERLAQEETNKMNEGMAISQKNQAFQFAAAQNAMIAKTELEIRKLYAEAWANKWNGQINSAVLPEGSPFLFPLENK